jgi:large exoprotein involved in heme utilization and adhesion
VEALTRGIGKAGNIEVNAKDSVVISGNSDYTTSSGLYTSTELGAGAQAGNINVKTGELHISGNAVLNARSRSNYRAVILHLKSIP